MRFEKLNLEILGHGHIRNMVRIYSPTLVDGCRSSEAADYFRNRSINKNKYFLGIVRRMLRTF